MSERAEGQPTPAEQRELTEEEIARAFAEPENAMPVGSGRPRAGLPRA